MGDANQAEIADLETQISANYEKVLARIARAATSAGREKSEIDLLLAVKFQSLDALAAAYKAGCRLMGHNLAQQMRDTGDFLASLSTENHSSAGLDTLKSDTGGTQPKNATAAGERIEMHMIGHLQTNKINQVLKYATCVESLDSVNLATKISQAAERYLDQNPGLGMYGERQTLDVFVQVNTSGELPKTGVRPDEALSFANYVANLPHLNLRGFMTVGALNEDLNIVEKSLAQLREIQQQALRDLPQAKELSMGMTQDLEIAIKHGSTLVRVGTAVFGPRQTSK